MSKKWNKGPPPSLGWWPASVARDSAAIRWWDGQCWSVLARPNYSAKLAAAQAKIKYPEGHQHLIKWSDRPASWPARSRT
jgi:hypothetical protein